MAANQLMPPENGATVRMYRTGHGDCFLIAFAGDDAKKPVYVLIDCGYKPGSNGSAHINTKIKEITKNIQEATGGHVDVAVITHEHQDHVNGITETNFGDLTIGQAWFAWTEDPDDDLANQLRTAFKDKLLGLLAMRHRLAAAASTEEIDRYLEFELGGADGLDLPAAEALLGAARKPLNSDNKKSMKVFKDRAAAGKGSKFLRPHGKIHKIPGAKDLRVFSLGPPRKETELKDLDPEGGEVFHFGSMGDFLAGKDVEPPFAKRYSIVQADSLKDPDFGKFFSEQYGGAELAPIAAQQPNEVPCNPEWRRIDDEWLRSAEQLALDINDYTNNSSLVLAFELGKGGKVLLFAADAQRGNWKSWNKKDWKDGSDTITAKDLLSRTVLYKVGHHGSHNATLNGVASDDYANISWMAQGEHAAEFTAMITAVRSWAETQDGWDHPQQAIKDALVKKCSGRVFQTDRLLEDMEKPRGVDQSDWKAFLKRCRGEHLYFDYDILA